MEYRKHALILEVVERLREHGSWSGKTHDQKSLFLVKVAARVDVPFEYILYKHGPYSFDPDAELEQMKSYAALVSETIEGGYGPVLRPGTNAPLVHRQVTLQPEEIEAIERICGFVGSRNVAELERLASAGWIRIREGLADPKQVAERLHALKPHVSLPDAERAQKDTLWALYQTKFGLDPAQRRPGDRDWTAAEIRACCRLAALLGVDLVEAAGSVVPVAVTAGEAIEPLRRGPRAAAWMPIGQGCTRAGRHRRPGGRGGTSRGTRPRTELAEVPGVSGPSPCRIPEDFAHRARPSRRGVPLGAGILRIPRIVCGGRLPRVTPRKSANPRPTEENASRSAHHVRAFF